MSNYEKLSARSDRSRSCSDRYEDSEGSEENDESERDDAGQHAQEGSAQQEEPMT